MIKRIHILGASGSGTSTLAEALEKELGFRHFDTDNYFWLPTDPPFEKKRPAEDRIRMIVEDISGADKWTLSGSLCGWGDVLIQYFDLIVYLWIPMEVRILRLIEREQIRYGKEAIEKGGARHSSFKEFIEWASQYDSGGMEIRSKVMHKAWLSSLECPVLRLEGDMTVDERVNAIKDLL